jgi:hypothetical protein
MGIGVLAGTIAPNGSADGYNALPQKYFAPATTSTGNPSEAATTDPNASATDATTASPDPAGDASRQAASIDALLNQGRVDRASLGTALANVHACKALPQATNTIQAVSNDRNEQLAQLQRSGTDALPRGIASGLTSALTESAQADAQYLSWAQAVVASGCMSGSDVPQTSDLDQANASSALATASKSAFLAVWNPFASAIGLPTRTQGEI